MTAISDEPSFEKAMKSFGEYKHFEKEGLGSLENRVVTNLARLGLDFCESTIGRFDRLIEHYQKNWVSVLHRSKLFYYVPLSRTFLRKATDFTLFRKLDFEKGIYADGSGLISENKEFFWQTVNEKPYFESFTDKVSEASVVLDVGADKGLYGIQAAHLGAEAYLFECDSFFAEKAKKNVELNDVEDRCSVSNQYVSDSLSQFSTTIDSEKSKLDSSIDLVKIDVEGAELQVLKGAEETLESDSPTVFVECHSEEKKEKCSKFLRQFGYRLEKSWSRGSERHCIFCRGEVQ